MATALALTIKAAIEWTWTEAIGTDVGSVVDQSKFDYNQTLANGTGSNQADRVWRKRTTLTGSGTVDYDLNALTYTLFGATVSLNLQNVKAVCLINLNTVSGDDLTIGNNGIASNKFV